MVPSRHRPPHSISKPWMVRRAVWKAWKQPTRGMGSLDPEVVALDPLLQVLGDVMHRGARQEPVFPGRRDSGWVGPRTVGADPVGGEQRLILQHLAKEALGGIEVALCREQEVDRRAVFVDGPVQIPPPAADLDVCLVDAD